MDIGVDEAGRGPVLGPLVVAAVGIDEKVLDLNKLGICDSKLMSPEKRQEAFQILSQASSYCILEIPARSIDLLRRTMTMNSIEVSAFSTVVSSLIEGDMRVDGVLLGNIEHRLKKGITGRGRIVMDAADVDERRFCRLISDKISSTIDLSEWEMVSEHKADLNHRVVGAASVLAKVTRDTRVQEYKATYGKDIGSGYPGDPRTREFLMDHVLQKGCLPEIARATWETSRRILSMGDQSSLLDFR
ncbi:MAG: ribonuclease HII [Thermoplasmatota archaeon]